MKHEMKSALLVPLLIFAMAVTASANDPVVVGVEVDIEMDTKLRKLNVSKGSLATRIREIYVRLGRATFGFLDWQAREDTRTRLTVRLYEQVSQFEDNNGRPSRISRIALEYGGRIGDVVLDEGDRITKVVYDYESDGPGNLQGLMQTLNTHAESHFKDPLFRADLKERYVNLIALGSEARSDPARKVVHLPISAERLKLSPGSVFYIQLDSPTDPDDNGFLVVKMIGVCEREEWAACVQCRPIETNFPLLPVEGWSPKIPDILSKCNVTIFMDKYVRRFATRRAARRRSRHLEDQ